MVQRKPWENFREIAARQLRLFDDDESIPNDGVDLIDEVEQAHEEWLGACSYFENVTDPDLIDHAIYSMEAAERKYMYILKKARVQGIQLDTVFTRS